MSSELSNELSRLSRLINKLEDKIEDLEREVKRNKSYEAKLLLCLTNPEGFAVSIDNMHKRTEELAQRLQSYIFRECVLTEVSRYARSLGSADLIAHFHIKLVDAFNWGEEFWDEKGLKDLSIEQWFRKIVECEPVPSQERRDEFVH